MSRPPWLADAARESPWSELSVVVAGIGVSGFAAADALVQLGARVTVVDEGDGDDQRERANILEILDATVRLGGGATAELPAGTQLVVTSPGWRPTAPLLVAAADAGIPVWGEVELAWRLRDPATPWLALTGTNGKTTTLRMLTEMLRASGLRVGAAGNVGEPVVSAVMDPVGHDVLAVELSSFQLHWTHSLAVRSAAVLNIAPDHLDWHGSAGEYAAAKGRIYQGVETACVYNVADPATEQLVRDADVVEGARAIGFTLGIPAVGMVGVVDDVLVDRAFIAERQTSAAELGTVDDVQPAAPHNVANALAAAALARSVGVPPVAVRDGLHTFTPDPHRVATVATIDGVRYVDDSKATNPHAAAASLQAYESVVWIAGGLAKGAVFDELVIGARERLRGVVLIGADRHIIKEALGRHAPDVPVIELSGTDNMAMDRAVQAAAEAAHAGDTVLLAPACASMDMFANYARRGDAFAAAVHRHDGH
ncbi:UDP-N-acetylmuramoyl-L-alanine--D-glutamate ligase [Phytoactinopolyspora limicola]|uniref:UDP-N-acetylmuramoyl-L-alanine--D-glutamate ligase n=1 Tax=Phytoactinopolyspora limicola TaxID=2715536 RepID=UPI001FE2FC1B|nr:UDP-N-acetylmuramoyl-L-alanine--D-glutamate ligase [Phytoactinopolyspora limicola]